MSTAQIVPGLEKGLSVLELISAETSGIRFEEILNTLPVTRTTLFRLLKTLEKKNYILKHKNRYFPVSRFSGPDRKVLLKARNIMHPFLRNLLHFTGETVEAAVLETGRILYIAKLEAPDISVRMRFNEWEYHTHMHASGICKVMLAHAPVEDVRRITTNRKMKQFTPGTITDLDEFEKDLKKIRRKGGSIECEENRIGVKRISAPVFVNKTIFGAIGYVGLISNMTGRKKDREILKKVRDCADRISEKLSLENEE